MELNHHTSSASATPTQEEEESSNNTSSDEMFSFPGTPLSSDFEFGCVTPTSPSSNNTDPEKHHVSPADQFFLNGRLLPHSFQPTTTTTQSSRTSISDAPPVNFPIRPSTSLTTSRTSSIRSSSKEDSLMSSRSNSTSSSRSSGMTMSVSCCSSSSSARTSSSDLSERRAFQSRMVMSGREKMKIGSYNECIKRGGYCSSGNHRCRGYGSGSQRWQFIISPVPVLDPCSLSMRRRSGEQMKGSLLNGKKVIKSPKRKNKATLIVAGRAAGGACDGRKSTERGSSSSSSNDASWSGFWERSLRSFVKRCKSCHAMDQADVDDRDDDDDDDEVVTSRNMEVK